MGKFGWGFTTFVALLLIIAFGITMSIRQSTQFTDDCHNAGGYVYQARNSWLCLDDDGRVIVP